ncbi:MAG: hypothetical protein ACFFFH_06905 [Candidatus Thorarchaeota archaeon]
MSNNRTFLTALLGSILVLSSGCLEPSGGFLDLELLTEDQLVFFNEEFLNLTLTDLSPYPTLQESIQKVIDPTMNTTGIFVAITTDEMNRILTELLTTPTNETYNYIAYGEYLFQISFAVP